MWCLEHCDSYDILGKFGMSNLPLVLMLLLGGFVFLFAYWKRIREDYISRFVFASGFYIIIGVLIGATAFQLILPHLLHQSPVFQYNGLWFWGGVAGGFAGLFASVNLFKMKFTEVFEAAGIGLLLWFGISILAIVLASRKTDAILFSLSSFLIFGLYRFLDAKYRRFTWYKSGRVGFAGIMSLGVFFLIRAALILGIPGSDLHIGKVGVIPSAVAAFLLFYFVYNLSEGQWQLKTAVQARARLKKAKKLKRIK